MSNNYKSTLQSNNTALNADFVGTPLDGELWYNDYIIYDPT